MRLTETLLNNKSRHYRASTEQQSQYLPSKSKVGFGDTFTTENSFDSSAERAPGERSSKISRYHRDEIKANISFGMKNGNKGRIFLGKTMVLSKGSKNSRKKFARLDTINQSQFTENRSGEAVSSLSVSARSIS